MCKTGHPVNSAIWQIAFYSVPRILAQGASYTLDGSPGTGAILKKMYTPIPG